MSPPDAPASASPSPAAEFQQAVAHHVGGRLAQAEVIYRRILEADPKHFDALHLLGVIFHQTARNTEAVEYIRGAIEINDAQPAAHSNLGLALLALKLPNEALASFGRALAIDGRYVDALVNHGHALRDLGRPAEAVASYDRALAISPASAVALNSRGIALLEAGHPAEALGSFDRALELIPGSGPLHCNRGNALQALKRHSDAVASYDQALLHAPGLAEAHANRGHALRDLGRAAEALDSVDRALALRPGSAGALNLRGIILRDLNRQTEALETFDRALAIEPGHADVHCNRGNVLQDLHRHAQALESYTCALAADPGHAESHWNESLCRLLLADFGEGWRKYEWRWKTEQANQARGFAQPVWLGKAPLEGKTILLHAEQGFGDTLQFCRYASKVGDLGARVILEVQPPLKALMSGLPGLAAVIARGEALPAFDVHCPLLSLPLAFNTSLDSIPAERAYLRSDPARVDRWRRRLPSAKGRRVGLVWSGSGALRNDPARSLPLSALSGLRAPGVQFVCLQKEISAHDREGLALRGDVHCFSEELVDFAETAALADLMDIVITVDTAVAHLAGALGKEVWILLPHAPTWRWLLDRKDSPWYPTARLFRASRIGDWGGAVDAVIAALAGETR